MGCFDRSRHGWPELLSCFEKRKRRLSAWAQETVGCGHSSQKSEGSRRPFFIRRAAVALFNPALLVHSHTKNMY
ncbi:hypothetical protein BDV38DRAFT_242922 [Aspergillus pseudotamarii]|uniref:Uncharacterized protein n=1 Tax=Aspergillus pseudotamarii TaxID=132259 RepID=A0A5N6SWW0_ASPPS|nr:uncharacterized protein BDV38DRAFT_242922 [Aspergillus pseudotamarii]KAE8139166.1 hypothetical protein BDV38DRAFT_242922 [Aspergillus pseudotamarii]